MNVTHTSLFLLEKHSPRLGQYAVRDLNNPKKLNWNGSNLMAVHRRDRSFKRHLGMRGNRCNNGRKRRKSVYPISRTNRSGGLSTIRATRWNFGRTVQSATKAAAPVFIDPSFPITWKRSKTSLRDSPKGISRSARRLTSNHRTSSAPA